MATQQSSWDDMSSDPVAQVLGKLPKNKLVQVAIAKDQAFQDAKNNGTPMVPTMPGAAPTQPTPASMGQADDSISMTPSQSQGPLDMNSMDLYNANDMGDASSRLGTRLGAVRQNTQTFKRSSSRLFDKTPDEIRAEQMRAQGIYPNVSGYEQATDESGKPMFDSQGQSVLDKDRPQYDFDNTKTDEQNPVRMQQKGLDRMQALLGMEASYQKDKNHMDYSPLAALADQWNARSGNPSNFAASMPKPDNSNESFMKYADEIQKRQADVQKSIQEGVKAQKGGSTMDLLTQAVLNRNNADQNNPTRDYNAQVQATALRAQDAQAARAHQQILNKLSNDKQLQTELQTYNGLGTGLSVIQNAKNITPQIVDEAQQAIKQSMSMGRGTSGGVDERTKTYMNSVGLTTDRLQQFLTGKPTDIANNDEIVQHLKNLAAIEQGNVQTMFSKRLNAVSAGAGWVYNNPRYQSGGDGMDFASSLQDALSAQHAQLPGSGATRPAGGQKAINKVTVSPSNVKKNNMTPAQAAISARPNPQPNANADLGSMSNDELKAFIKAHGGS